MRGLPNDVYFKVGLITIIGLSAKNAILIIEFAKDLQAQGKALVEAVLEAAHLRFRPILMTSMAFICGVLPLVIATGAGSASQRAIGTGVMGGMIAVVSGGAVRAGVLRRRAAHAGGGPGEGGEDGSGRGRRARAGVVTPPARQSLHAPRASARSAHSGFKIFTNSPCTNSLPHTTWPVFSASSLPPISVTRPPASRTMIWPAAMSQGCRLRSQ